MGVEELTDLMLDIKNMGEGEVEPAELLAFIEDRLAEQLKEDA